MKPNEKPNIKSFFNYASKLTTSKAPIDNDRSGHRSTLFASPPFKTTNCSNISSILNQITTTRTSQRPIYCISERKINEIGTGYINLDKKKKTLLKKEPQLLEKNDKKFMKDIENCINYFENKQEVDKNYHNEELVKKQIFEERKRHHSYNSFHEFNKEKNNKMSNLHDREKVLLNEINCHKAKEREYIKKISYYDGKTKKLQASLKERKKKASEAKFMYLKEQIMKENALGVLRNILENSNDKDYIETMKRLMKNDNGSLLLNFGHYQAKPALETKYSLFEKKSTNDEEYNRSLSSSEIEDIMKTDKALITTMIQDGKSKKNKESPNLHCDEILDFKDSELTLLDDNFY